MNDANTLNTTDDPRWMEFERAGLQCSCGQRHVGLFALHMLAPVGWTGAVEYAPDDSLEMTGDFLSESYCVWQGQYFALRMRLPIRIRGKAQSALVYTVWASVYRPDMEGYIAARKNGTLDNNVQFAARLVNNIAGYPETANLAGLAFEQEDKGVPVLLISGPQPGANPRHPLIAAQRVGITIDRVFELYAAYGHDMRGPQEAPTH